MFFFILLKRAKVSARDIISFYHTYIRPVQKHITPLLVGIRVLHTFILPCIGCVFKRRQSAFRSARSAAFHMLTTSYCTYNMSSLKDRRIEQCNKLFELVVSDSAHKLHYLLPPKNVYVSRYNLLETSVNLRNLRCAPSFFPIPLSNLCLSGRTLARSFIETFYGGHL